MGREKQEENILVQYSLSHRAGQDSCAQYPSAEEAIKVELSQFWFNVSVVELRVEYHSMLPALNLAINILAIFFRRRQPKRTDKWSWPEVLYEGARGGTIRWKEKGTI
jgi:hypothetical protein